MTDNVNVSWKENIRIMQLTDLHFVRIDGTGPEQETLDMIRDMIQAEKPDFIAITGDMCLSDAADCCYHKFCKFMDEFGARAMMRWSIFCTIPATASTVTACRIPPAMAITPFLWWRAIGGLFGCSISWTPMRSRI